MVFFLFDAFFLVLILRIHDFSRLSTVKWTGAKSAVHSEACNSFIPTTSVNRMRWGRLGIIHTGAERCWPCAAKE